MRTISKISISNTIQTSTTETSTFSPSTSPTAAQRSPWHSPVPYLFGGLAAMLGLIAFALLILACSYWRLSGRQMDDRDQEGHDQRDLERGGARAGDKDSGDTAGKAMKVYDEKILVIMAGDKKPTFLATPVFAKVSSLEDGNNGKEENRMGESKEAEKENSEKIKKEVVMMMINDHHDHCHDHHDGANSTTTDHDSRENQLEEATDQNQ